MVLRAYGNTGMVSLQLHNVEYVSECLLISKLSGEIRNSVGRAKLAEPIRRVSGRA